MNKLHQAIEILEQSASVRDHVADVRVLELLRAHAEDDICFGERFTELQDEGEKLIEKIAHYIETGGRGCCITDAAADSLASVIRTKEW